MHGHASIYFKLTGKRYHSHMAGGYCIVICKNAAGGAFSFSCSFSSLLCFLFFLLLLLFLPLFLLFLFLLLLLLFCSLPPALVLFLFLFVATLTTNSAEKYPKTRKRVGKNIPKRRSPVSEGRAIALAGSMFEHRSQRTEDRNIVSPGRRLP